MITWPEALVAELSSRRCLVFFGAGASKGCLSQDGKIRPENWEGLLLKLLSSMTDRSDEVFIRSLITEKRYLDAAEVLRSRVSEANFNLFITKEFETPHFQPSNIHKAIHKIDPKIVVTTNFDNIYDNYCNGFGGAAAYSIAKYYESHILNSLRSPKRLVIKAHGCVSDPQKIVLTRSQYFGARKDYSGFYEILNSIFLTSSIIFIGYSISDPDIQLVLENSNIAVPSVHRHYFLTEEGQMHSALRKAMEDAYNLEFITFAPGDFIELEESLKELSDLVLEHRESHPE